MTNIKNIIFDLGGVLINIDYHKTADAFKALGVINFEEMYSQFHSNELFEQLETGKIDENSFYEQIRKHIHGKVSNEQIEQAWNSMVLDFRKESIAFLEQIASKYALYLLSNTNCIHLKYVQKVFTQETGKALLDNYFTKCWYSHLIGLRKPRQEIYEFILQDAGILANESLFIDDSINNIEAAAAIGIKSVLLAPGVLIENMGL